MTVLGPIDSAELGVTLPHEHLLVDLFRVFQPNREFLLNNRELAIAELRRFADAGGNTIVELTTPDMARDPAGLAAIAKSAEINIIMGCGRYREPFYEEAIGRMRTRDLAASFIADIETGVDGIRPGIIGEIGTHNPWMSPAEERVFRAAAQAQIATGLTVSLHAVASTVGLEQLELLVDEGVPPQRIVVGHCDTHPFLDYHRALLERGAWVEYDTVRGQNEFETQQQLRNLLTLVREGHIEKLLLSHDVCLTRHLSAYGGGGYAFLLTDFKQRLVDAGLTDNDLELLFVENPRRMLSGG